MRTTIRAVLQKHLIALDAEKPFLTAWEGVEYVETLKPPFQAVNLILSTSESVNLGEPKAKMTGFLNVALYFPFGQGTAEIEQRAQTIVDHFNGLNEIKDGVQVIVFEPPLISQIYKAENQLMAAITINFTAIQI